MSLYIQAIYSERCCIAFAFIHSFIHVQGILPLGIIAILDVKRNQNYIFMFNVLASCNILTLAIYDVMLLFFVVWNVVFVYK